MKRLIWLSAAALLAASSTAVAADPETYAFQLTVGTNKCKVEYPRSDHVTLYLLLTNTGKLNAGVYQPRWEIVDDKNTDSEDHPATLEMKDGAQATGKTTATWGGYSNGFNQGIWSAWDAGKPSDDALALLAKSTVVTVKLGNEVSESFDMKQKGFAAAMLKNCVKDLPK